MSDPERVQTLTSERSRSRRRPDGRTKPSDIGVTRWETGAPRAIEEAPPHPAPVSDTIGVCSRATLDVSVSEGWGRKPIGRIFCARRDLPKLGDERHVSQLSVRVRELTADGLPSVVRFEFTSPLEAASRGWLIWRGRRIERWSPPPIGARASVAATPLLESLPM